MVSQKLKAAIKLGDEPAYRIAQKAGIDLNLGKNKWLDLMERSVTAECTT